MNKRSYFIKRHHSRLDRVEKKCDRILSELLILRHYLSSRPDIDITIEKLHTAARQMRNQCERELENARKMCNAKFL